MSTSSSHTRGLQGDPAFAQGVAIVAGGSGGIGAEICVALAKAGSNVALTYRTNESAANLVSARVRYKGVQAVTERVDLTDFEAVRSFVDRVKDKFGRIHSVVYASGPDLHVHFISQLPPAEWRRIMDADVNGCFHLVRAALPHLRQGRGGSLLAVTTAATRRFPVRDVLSAAPKALIETLFQGIDKEEGRFNIRANCVGPGWINTKMAMEVAGEMKKEQFDAIIKSLPLRRLGRPEEIAEAALFLLSSKASFITGQCLAVDGGLQL